MSKKDKKHKKKDTAPSTDTPSADGMILTRRGWKIVGGGVGVLLLGFLVLSFTDPRGQNFASTLSPFLIIGGYTLIGFGIVAKDK